MTQRVSVSWNPDECEMDFASLEQSGVGAKYRIIDKINEALRLFSPLEHAIHDRQRWSKKKLLKDPSLRGCEVILTRKPRSTSYEVGKYLCVDVEFDPLSLLEMPTENRLAGPVAVDVFRRAEELLEESGGLSGGMLRDVLSQFVQNGYTYTWNLKDIGLRRLDFRAKVDIRESSERTTAVLTISSEKRSISEQVEIHTETRIHPQDYNPSDMLPDFDPDRKISLDELRKLKIDAKGIHIAPTAATQMAADMARSESEDVDFEEEYRITVGAKDLSEEVCALLRIAG